jgi:hypothetical protein
MLLSSVFPITERSGVNLKGEFNTENVTLVESDDVVIVPELASTPSQSQKGDVSRVPAGEAMDVDQGRISTQRILLCNNAPTLSISGGLLTSQLAFLLIS